MPTRKSPEGPAKNFKGQTKRGLDKRKWKSTKSPCGTTYTWRRVDTKCKAEGTCKPKAKCPKVSIVGRKSPARPAKEFPGQTKKGLDGLYWVSSLDSRGYYTWRRPSPSPPSSKTTTSSKEFTPHVCKIHTNVQECGFDPNCKWTARGCIRKKGVLTGTVYQTGGINYRNTSGITPVCKIHENSQECGHDPNCKWTANGCIHQEGVLTGAAYAGPYGQSLGDHEYEFERDHTGDWKYDDSEGVMHHKDLPRMAFHLSG